MQKSSKSGFHFYGQNSLNTFLYQHLKSKNPQDQSQLSKSIQRLQQLEESGQNNIHIKTKQKRKQISKQDTKRYDRGGNCVASNTSKLFIKILNKRLSKFPDIENYLKKYQIYSQKQNILLIPLCLYSFLKQYKQKSLQRFHQNQVAHQKKILLTSQQHINTQSVYKDIINQLKQHIQCSLQNSKAKSKDCPQEKKQFHLKNISIYNKISEIIKKVQQISNFLKYNENQKSLSLKKQKQFIQKVNQNVSKSQIQQNYAQNRKLLTHQLNTDVKIQQQPQYLIPVYDKQKIVRHINQQQVQLKKSYETLQKFQAPLQSLYERKQRQYQKAMDKLFSIIMNELPLRDLFDIFKLNVQQILLQSVNYCYRRNINSRVKKNEKIIKLVYDKLENQVLQTLNKKQNNNNNNDNNNICSANQKYIQKLKLRRWQFLISYLTLKIAGDKRQQIYQEFKQNIKRKIKYFQFQQNSQSNNLKQSFDRKYYDNSLKYLQICFEKQKNKKKQEDSIKLLFQIFQQWLISYQFNQEFDKAMVQDPIKSAQKEINKFVPNYLHYGEQSQMPSISNLQSTSILTLPQFHSKKNQKQQMKQQNFIINKLSKSFMQKQQIKKKRKVLQNYEQFTLKKLLQKYKQLQKQNYEGII